MKGLPAEVVRRYLTSMRPNAVYTTKELTKKFNDRGSKIRDHMAYLAKVGLVERVAVCEKHMRGRNTTVGYKMIYERSDSY